jgi:hypothetical protein
MVRMREYLRPLYDDADALDIIVRVYSNLEGMANNLVRLDKVRNLGQLRAFATGFCGRVSSFDWVDTGVGKEGGSGRKVRGMCKDLTSEGIFLLTPMQKIYLSTPRTLTSDRCLSPVHPSTYPLPSYPTYPSTRLL